MMIGSNDFITLVQLDWVEGKLRDRRDALRRVEEIEAELFEEGVVVWSTGSGARWQANGKYFSATETET